MPDWSWTLLGPLARRLPREGRAAALRLAGAFGAQRHTGRFMSAFGGTLPAPSLRRVAGGLDVASPVGARADVRLAATMARIGAGFVVVDVPGRRSAEEAARTLRRRPPGVPVVARLAVGDHVADSVARLAEVADAFALDDGGTPPARAAAVTALRRAASLAGRAALLGPDDGRAEGVALSGEPIVVHRARARAGDRVALLAVGHVREPADALALLDAGATLVAIDAQALLDAGPGLLKRIHEALRPAEARPAGLAWAWLAALGIGMLIAGAVAAYVGLTRVVLPYDEAFVGLDRDGLAALDPELIPFLSHDRVTLAGTMMSIGALYTLVAWFARGERWARVAISASATVGFLSFFLYLGFGYFDPLHAMIAGILLPFFLLGARRGADAFPRVPAPDLRNDAAWRRARWGQLGFVTLGVGLILAGGYIAYVGTTSVFVPEDVGFLGLDAAALAEANPRVLPLVAHDRAGLGGALVSEGILVLLLALWGVRRGARWVWWTFAAAGALGFGAAIGVHYDVGYTHWRHLAPAFLALGITLASLGALWTYLAGRPPPRPAAPGRG